MQRIETETNLTNLLMAELVDAARTGKFVRRGAVLVDADNTTPQQLYSSPYEKVEIAPIPLARRKRASTIPRALLAQKQRFTSPYEAIEILPGQSISMVASGTFEAAWFASPDDEIVEPEAPAQKPDATKWMMLGGALLGACAIVTALLTYV